MLAMETAHRREFVQNTAAIFRADRCVPLRHHRTNSSRVAMLIRLMSAPAEHPGGEQIT